LSVVHEAPFPPPPEDELLLLLEACPLLLEFCPLLLEFCPLLLEFCPLLLDVFPLLPELLPPELLEHPRTSESTQKICIVFNMTQDSSQAPRPRRARRRSGRESVAR
jgi:hypothetical protein